VNISQFRQRLAHRLSCFTSIFGRSQAQTPLILLDQSGSDLPGKLLRNDIFFHPSNDIREAPLDRGLGKAKSIKTAYANAAGSKRLKRGPRLSQ
jgi:hypothetical protein